MKSNQMEKNDNVIKQKDWKKARWQRQKKRTKRLACVSQCRWPTAFHVRRFISVRLCGLHMYRRAHYSFGRRNIGLENHF